MFEGKVQTKNVKLDCARPEEQLKADLLVGCTAVAVPDAQPTEGPTQSIEVGLNVIGTCRHKISWISFLLAFLFLLSFLLLPQVFVCSTGE